MHRRSFLRGAAASAVAVNSQKWLRGWPATPQSAQNVRLTIHREQHLGTIPPDFMGLGYEISTIATPAVLSGENHSYIALVRQLGAHGVIRVGGNTSDYSAYGAQARAVSSPKHTIINQTGLRELSRFLNATGWSLIWGLNLGNGGTADAVAEARAVAQSMGSGLLAFEIGNEPDLYVHEGHRREYSYEQYVSDYQRYKAAVRAAVPHAAFAGPDAAGATDWVERFARQEGNDLRLLTHHYYREGQNPSSSAEKLLHPDQKLAAMLKRMRAASEVSKVPYRICETNSFSGGGRPGVSDTFAAALWVLDYLCVLAWNGAAGVNIETGINQLDFISSYSPIISVAKQPAHGMDRYQAAPEYYGMLAFAQGCRGTRIGLDYEMGGETGRETDGINVTAYATVDAGETVRVVVINKDAAQDADVRIAMGVPSNEIRMPSGTLMRLAAPSLDSKANVTLGGVALSSTSHWRGRAESLRPAGDAWIIRVPAGSAALVSFPDATGRMAVNESPHPGLTI